MFPNVCEREFVSWWVARGGRVWLVVGWARPPLFVFLLGFSLQDDAATCVCFWLLKIRSEFEAFGSLGVVPLLRWREC